MHSLFKKINILIGKSVLANDKSLGSTTYINMY